MKRILLFLVCLFLTTNATAICPKKDIEVAFKRKYGEPIYNYNLTHKDFHKYSPAPMSKIIRGLTIGELGVSYGEQGRVFKHKDGYCAGVKKVDFYIGYDYFKVFIDKKYKRNTCEFKAVKLHEDEHVAIFNASVELESNKTGSFLFTIYSDHPQYSLIKKMKSKLLARFSKPIFLPLINNAFILLISMLCMNG